MPLEIKLHHSKEELILLYRNSKDAVEKTRLHFLSMVRSSKKNDSLLALSLETAMKRVNMKRTWAQDTLRRYNTLGLQGITDGRGTNARPRLLSKDQEVVLEKKITLESPEDGGLWTGPKVALYLGEILGKEINAVLGWRYLKRNCYFVLVTKSWYLDAETSSAGQELFWCYSTELTIYRERAISCLIPRYSNELYDSIGYVLFRNDGNYCNLVLFIVNGMFQNRI